MKRGDKVNYTVCKKVGKGFKMSSREGVYQDEIAHGIAEIKSKNGRMLQVKINELSLVGERSALTRAIMGDN